MTLSNMNADLVERTQQGPQVKAQADDLFKQGQFEEANIGYTQALEFHPGDPVLLNNRSLALHRLGLYSQALEDALASTASLTSEDGAAAVDDFWIQTLAKSFYRQGSALLGMGRPADALLAVRKGLKVLPGDPGIVSSLHSCIAALFPLPALTAALALAITEGEAPALLSAREGKILKPVFPVDSRLSGAELEGLLRQGLAGREEECRSLLTRQCLAGPSDRQEGEQRLFFPRFALAGYRAWAYLIGSNSGQAIKDARLAVAWSKTKSSPGWPRAHYLVALALEGCAHELGLQSTELAPKGEANRKFSLHCATTTAAAISMRRAFEILPDNPEFARELKRLSRKVPDDQRKVLFAEGADALTNFLEEEKWRNAPEYMRPRPKYYYYYEWMKDRIFEHYPALPEPVMDKLLAMDASELDLLLQYPKAIRGQVEEYLEVFRDKGGKYLETYRTPSLSWEEVKAMKGAGTVGLGTGFNAPGEGHLLEGGGAQKNTDHALVGGGGDGRLTQAERVGLPALPSLPPDQLRDRDQLVQAQEKQQQQLLDQGGTRSASGRQATIMHAAENAVLEATKEKKNFPRKEIKGTGDLDGVD